MNWFELSVKVDADESVPVSLPTIYYHVVNLKVKDAVKILGVHFTYNRYLRKKLNFIEIISSIKKETPVVEVEKFNSLRTHPDCKNVCNSDVDVPSWFNLY